MAGIDDVRGAVERAFGETARGLPRWPDPHAGRPPAEAAYSRLTAPERWRIVGARADAWREALVGVGLADARRVAPTWARPPGSAVTRAEEVVPRVAGGLRLLLCRSALGPVADAGVTVGVGDPAVAVALFPECGCDACDTGSRDVLDHLDEHLAAIVTGTFRHLASGRRSVTVLGEGRWSATGVAGPVERLLRPPSEWDERRGTSWFGSDRG